MSLSRPIDNMAAMDTIPNTIHRIGAGFYQMYSDIRSFDPFHIDWHNANYTALFLSFVVAGTFVFVLIAQLTDSGEIVPGISAKNSAVNDSKGVVHNPDDPPIPPPTEVISLRIYPIKSCRGIEISKTRLRKSGLTLDRNWMFIDSAKRDFMTIRQDKSMTLIDTDIYEDEQTKEQMLEVSIHGTDASVKIPAFPSKQWLEQNTTLSTVEIWGQKTDGYEYPASINKIFCDYFNKEVALVYKGPTIRNCSVNARPELYGKGVPHHFADVMSLQVASEASIKDLNRRLKLQDDPSVPELTIERFRPNIIVRGRDDRPWEEDTWKRIRITTSMPAQEAIYKMDLDVVARCARCHVPNVNPITADAHAHQPWKELMTFRRVDTGGPAKYKPCFGMLCVPKHEGIVQVGSTLEVLETTDKHLYNTTKFEDL
nr:uncharacterized protein ycbx [Quercus suber]